MGNGCITSVSLNLGTRWWIDSRPGRYTLRDGAPVRIE